MPDGFTSCQKTYAAPEESFSWLIFCLHHNDQDLARSRMLEFTAFSYTDLGEQDTLGIACPKKLEAELSDKLNDWF